MKQMIVRGQWAGGIKALAVGFFFFLILTLILGAVIRFTPMPERWMGYAMIVVLSLACLLSGFLAGKRIGKRGMLFGILFSALLILVVVGLGMLMGMFMEQPVSSGGFLRLSYLPCILCGCAGGLAGVNMRTT